MSQVRGAAAPTSGAQDYNSVDEEALDRAVADVREHVLDWAQTPASVRAEILQRIVDDTFAVDE